MSEPVMPLHRRKPEVTYRGPAPSEPSGPGLSILALIAVLVVLGYGLYLAAPGMR